MSDLIYLASPYTHVDMLVRCQRAMQAAHTAARLVEKGYFVYSPVLHGHEIDKWASDIPYQYWIDLGFKMLSRCDLMYVLMIPGWRQSGGIKKEIEFAESNDIPISYYDPTSDSVQEYPS